MKSVVRTCLTALLVLCFYGTNAQEVTAKAAAYATEANVLYRIDAPQGSYSAQMCRLDLYHPTDTPGYPTLIWLHGGGLTGGERFIPAQLKNKGFAIAAVEYRLAPKATLHEILDDAAASVAWVVRNIAHYGGDTHKIVLAGHSAGAWLTLMITLDKQYLAPYGLDPDTTLREIIPYSGQCITHFLARQQMGMSNKQPLIDSMAPLYFVRPDCPPVLIITGDRTLEMLGRYEENAYMWRMFQLVGHKNVQLRELQGFNHGNMALPAHYLTVQVMRALQKE